MRYLNGAVCVILLLFTAVQYNDPDGMFWGAIYLIAAVWTGLAAFKPSVYTAIPARYGLAICCALAFWGVLYFWPGAPNFWRIDVWWEEDPAKMAAAEAAREGMGMMIVFGALAVAAITALSYRKG